MPDGVTWRTITVSLPYSLVEFVDRQAACLNVSRSKVIAQALSEIKAAEEQRLAAEGYQFYAQEASEFAAASLGQVLAADQGLV